MNISFAELLGRSSENLTLGQFG